MDECLAVGSGLESPHLNLPLRGTLSTEPGSLWVWVHLCGGLGGAHLWLEVGVAVEQWCDGEQEWLPEKVVSVSLRMTWSVAGTFLEIYWNRELGRS